jgi:uncharacterized UBP type Zn finger protein
MDQADRRSDMAKRRLATMLSHSAPKAEPAAPCAHLADIPNVPPASQGCEQCLALGDTWVHLRACVTCGQVGCCDSSKNKHASGHYRATGHPVVRSHQPGENWLWCYVDEILHFPESSI